MKSIYFFIWIYSAGILCIKAQNSNNLTFPSPVPNPTLTIDSAMRANTSINLQTGFDYGMSVTSTKLLNLNISSNPPYVNTSYLGSALNPLVNSCATGLQIDVSKQVAETNGSFGVSSTGAATYNIPILISPGTKNMQPALSLEYNSQSGFGLLGTGWQLNGLSAITRVGHTIMLDGNSKGVQLSTNDVFALDGNRLFALVGSYGQNTTTYYTEQESFSTITSYGTSGNGPESFVVVDKNGNTLKYGLLSNSSLKGISDNSVLSWYLNELKDEYGNYMRYSYKQLDGEVVIDRIDYTGNAAAYLNPYNSVTFQYMPMAEKTTYYISGVEFRHTQLLKSISAFAGTQLVKKYLMDYIWDRGTYLNTVTEIDADGNQLNPTLFCWRDPNEGLNLNYPSSYIFSNPADYGYLTTVATDYDGDGFSDYLCFNAPGGRLRMMHNDFKNNLGASNTIAFSLIHDDPNTFHPNSVVLSNNVTDADRDNRQEVYSIVSDVTGYATSPAPSSTSYYVLKTTVDPSSVVTATKVGTYNTSAAYYFNATPTRFLYDVNDYDGDGTNDALRIDPENINLTTSSGTYNYAISGGGFARPFSFDSDNMKDFIILEKPGPLMNPDVKARIIRFNGSGLTQVYSQTFTRSIPLINNLSNFSTGDLNGDGLDDIVYITDARNEMYVCKGTGLAFAAPVKVDAFTPISTATNIDLHMQVTDINGDGKGDVIVTDGSTQLSTSGINNYFTYISLGDIVVKGGSYSGDWTHASVTEAFHYNYTYHNTDGFGGSQDYTYGLTKYYTTDAITGNTINGADLDGDGILDATAFAPGDEARIINIIGKPKENIFQVQTAFNKKIYIEYANTNTEIYAKNSSKNLIYKKESTTTYNAPLFDYKPSLYCVSKTVLSSGSVGQSSQEKKYIYKDAVYHSEGRGFLGFEKVIAFDLLTMSGTLSKSVFDTQYFIPLNTESTQGKFVAQAPVNGVTDYAIDNTRLTSKTTNAYQLVPRNTKGYFVQLNSSISKDYLNSTQTSGSYVYNLAAAGNLSSGTVIYGWNASPAIKTKLDNYTYVLNNGSYKLLSQLSTQTQAGDAPYSRSVDYNYDAQGHLTSVISDQSISGLSSHILTTAYSQFNTFGFPTQTSISAPDISPARSSSSSYDATGRFIIQQVNALGNFEGFVYDNKFGNLLQHTGITGLVTNYTYDALGRLIKTVLPNGAQNKVSYAWESPANYPYNGGGTNLGVYSIRTDQEANGYSKVYYSGTGNVLRTETQDFAGQTVVADARYSAGDAGYPDGLVLESTEPHYLSQAKFQVTHYDYETTFFRQSSQATYTTSSGNPSSATSTGIFAQTTYNSQSTDAAYNAPSVAITNQNGKVITKYNNSAGQLVQIKNVSPGFQQNTAYVYSSCGQPKSITLTTPANPGQNIVYSYTYNGLAQKTQAVDPSLGTISYSYSTLGELLKQTDPTDVFNYTYDVLGRPLTKTGSITGATTYQYITSGNGLLQIDKINGPNSTNEYKYDTFDRLTEDKETVLSTGKILKTNYAYDNYGREIQHTYPSGIITNNIYNGLGQLIAIKDNSNQPLWQLAGMDALGRIREYTYGNNINAKATYNDLNYLSTINYGNGSIQTQFYTYNGLTGNLTSRRFDNYLTNTGLKENFNFDNLDRLTQGQQVDVVSNNVLQTINTSFDILGNITHKDDAGDPLYNNSAAPFTMTYLDNPTSNINLNTQNVVYNDFDKVSQLSEMGSNKQMDFIYGNDNERVKVNYSIGGTNQYTRYYAQSYDRQENALGGGYKEWTYIAAPSGLCAVYYNNSGSMQLNYVHNDHLGSPVLLTNQSQQLVEEYAFDSWGRRRNPANWSYNSVPVPQKMIRGYTLHEMLDEFTMINMNGRVYEPALGRFIQPDDRVTDEANLQTYNIYAYCNNNPLKYADPTGHEGEFPVQTYDEMFNTTGALDEWYGNVSTAINYAENSNQYFSNSSYSDIGGNAYNINYNISGINNTAYQNFNNLNSYSLPEDAPVNFLNYLPVIGPALTSGNQLEAGNYLGAISSFGLAAFDIFTFGEGTASRIAEDAIVETTALVTKYPANAAIEGTVERTFLMPGETIDRYGSLNGNWFSTPGTLYEARSIPSGLEPYTQFNVLKPFEVERSLASPGMFSGQTGFGIQYQSPISADILIKRGIIQPF